MHEKGFAAASELVDNLSVLEQHFVVIAQLRVDTIDAASAGNDDIVATSLCLNFVGVMVDKVVDGYGLFRGVIRTSCSGVFEARDIGRMPRRPERRQRRSHLPSAICHICRTVRQGVRDLNAQERPPPVHVQVERVAADVPLPDHHVFGFGFVRVRVRVRIQPNIVIEPAIDVIQGSTLEGAFESGFEIVGWHC